MTPNHPDQNKSFDEFLADRRARTLPANLLDSARLPLASGEARRGTERDPRSVFYPISPRVVPDDVLALASYIEIQGEVYSLDSIRHCWHGSEVHCDYTEKKG